MNKKKPTNHFCEQRDAFFKSARLNVLLSWHKKRTSLWIGFTCFAPFKIASNKQLDCEVKIRSLCWVIKRYLIIIWEHLVRSIQLGKNNCYLKQFDKRKYDFAEILQIFFIRYQTCYSYSTYHFYMLQFDSKILYHIAKQEWYNEDSIGLARTCSEAFKKKK